MPTRKRLDREVNLLKLKEPVYLSLVASPANRSGFKVVRRDANGNTALKDVADLGDSKTEKRGDKSDPALLSLAFPEGVGAEDAKDLLDAFGMAEDYELRDENSRMVAYRRDAPEGVETADIQTAKGYTATVVVSRFARSDEDRGGVGVTLVAVEFGEGYNKESVEAWAESHGVSAKSVEQFDGGVALTRYDLPDDGSASVKKITVEPGIHAVVAATKRNDVPEKLYRSVVEQAYGNFGWGHLNFAAAMADPKFSMQMEDAVFLLREVLDNILLYSSLELEDRKALVAGALSDFQVFVEQIMDSLPSGTVAAGEGATSRSDNRGSKAASNEPLNEGTSMTTNSNQGQTAGNDNQSPDADNGAGDYVTRNDLAEAVSAALKEQIGPAVQEAIGAATAARSDTGADQTDNQADESSDGGAGGAQADGAGNDDGGVKALLDEIKAMRSDLGARLSKVENDLKEAGESTTVHTPGDNDAGAQTGTRKRSDQNSNPFTGMFDRSFGLGGE